MSALPRVYIARVRSGYDDQAALVAAIRKGLEYVGWTETPASLVGQVNLDFVYPDLAPAGNTRPEIVRAALTVLFEQNKGAKMSLLAGGPLDLPARKQAAGARGRGPELAGDGYFGLEKLFPGRVEIAPLDEEPLRSYKLSMGDPLSQDEREARDPATIDAKGRHAHEVRAPARLAEAEGLILFPKFKSSVRWSGLAGAIALAGGYLPAASERTAAGGLWRERRAVDFLEVAEPDLIITDAIEVGMGGSELTERQSKLGALVIARNVVAHDATLARFLGIRPDQIEAVRIAAERGYGPVWANEMEYDGDMGCGETASHVKGFGGHGYMPVVDFPKRFERELRLKLPVEILAAQPWDPCGAQGLLLDFLYTHYDMPKERRKLMAQWPAMTFLAGGFPDGPPPAPGNPLCFVAGDAAIDVWRRAGFGAGHGSSESFKTQDGKGGRAYFVRGEPPQMLELARLVAAATGGKVSSPVLQLHGFWDRLKAKLGIGGPPKQFVVGAMEAANIARLRDVKAARAVAPARAAVAPSTPSFTTGPPGSGAANAKAAGAEAEEPAAEAKPEPAEAEPAAAAADPPAAAAPADDAREPERPSATKSEG